MPPPCRYSTALPGCSSERVIPARCPTWRRPRRSACAARPPHRERASRWWRRGRTSGDRWSGAPGRRRSGAARFRRGPPSTAPSSASTCASIPSAMAPTVTWTYVTAAQTDTIPGQRIAPFAAGVVLPIAALTAVLHCVASVFGAATGSTRCTCWPSAAITSTGGRPISRRWRLGWTALTDAVAARLRCARCAAARSAVATAGAAWSAAPHRP